MSRDTILGMSFLVDPPLLIVAGAAIERVTPDEDRARLLETVTITAFLATSVSLYMNAPWTDWIATLCRAESGRDWMLNSGVFGFEHRHPTRATHVLAGVLFATYPLWLRAGRRMFPRSAARPCLQIGLHRGAEGPL